MAYLKTVARQEFETWSKEALRLVKKAEYKYAKKTAVSDYLLCASIFLTHARFENYFKDIVRYMVDQTNNAQLSCNLYPGRLRECQLLTSLPHSYLRRYYIHGDERLLLDNLHQSLVATPWDWARNDYKGTITTEAVLGKDGYPSTTNIRKVFYKLGIPNIFGELGRMLKTDVEIILDDINGLRGSMAHVGLPPLITPSDIGKRIVDLLRIVRAVDRIVQKNVAHFYRIQSV